MRSISRRLLLVVVGEHALRNLFHGHGEVVLRARLDQRRRIVVEGAFAELMVVVVDLPGPLRGNDDQRIARVHVLKKVVDARMDHGRDMVAVGETTRATRPRSSSIARCNTSFSTT